MKRKSVWLVSAALVAFVLSACNTVAGVGKDVEKAGEKIHDAARR
jgi:predicted small secreted protein